MRTQSIIFFLLLYISSCFAPLSGQTWEPNGPASTAKFNSIEFVSPSTGYAFGDSSIGAVFQRGVAYKTTDGGNSWSMLEMGSDAYKIADCHFLDSQNGIAVGRHNNLDGLVARTNDGGQSWMVDSLNFPERIHDVFFLNSAMGWIVGRNGYLAKTINGGINWMIEITNTGEHLNSVFFADQNTGWAVGDANNAATLLHSTDGGNTWTSQSTTEIVDFNSVYFSSMTQGWAVGQNGTIIHSTDGGQNWTPINAGTQVDLFDLGFGSLSTCWVAGGGGTLLKSTDSGITWGVESSNTLNDILDLSILSETQGWFAGDNGTIYSTGPTTALPSQISNDLEVSVYPNPARDWIECNISGAMARKSTFSILDLNGRKKLSFVISAPFRLRIENELAPGIYFWILEDGKGSSRSGKIVLL